MKLTISTISMTFSSVKNISTTTLEDWIKEHLVIGHVEDKLQATAGFSAQNRKLLILDCRPEEEYTISHLQPSVRVDFNKDVQEIIKQLPANLQSVGDLVNTDVVCYCSVGYRSSVVTDKLRMYFQSNADLLPTGEAFPAAYNLEGSLFKWANEHRHMVDHDGRETTFAHPYNTIFGKLLNSEYRRTTL